MLLLEQRLSEQVLQENIRLQNITLNIMLAKYHRLACHFFVVNCEFYYQYLSDIVSTSTFFLVYFSVNVPALYHIQLQNKLHKSNTF